MDIVHSPIFVALSVITACVGSWTALDLFRRARAHTAVWRSAWLGAASVAMGLSIWSMHFIAMLGFHPGAEVRYDVTLTTLSLLLPIAVTSFAFFSAIGRTLRMLIVSGFVMGAGICIMHYVGMAAIITSATLDHDPPYAVLAFVVAITASITALLVAQRERTFAQRALAAVVLGLAIVGMHYTAMLGVHVLLHADAEQVRGGIDSLTLAFGVAGGTLFILFLALIAALSDRRFEALAAREASHSELQMRAIIDNLPLGVFVAEPPSGAVRYANAEAKALLGHSLHGSAVWNLDGGQGAVSAGGSRLPPQSYALYQAMHEGRRVGPRVQRYCHKDGEIAELEVTAAPIPGRGAENALVVVAFQDVTAKLQAEETARSKADLKRLNELLEARVAAALADKAAAEAALAHAQRMEALGRLTGGLAHDFNNLLTVVIGALDIILRHPDKADRRTRLGEAALAAARRGERLTGQLLAFARRQPLQPEPCDVNELIRESEPLLRRAAPATFTLQFDLRAAGAIALIDPAQFEATLLNLIVNAVDASPNGGEISIHTDTRELGVGEIPGLAPGRYFLMRVKDTGSGMTPDVLDHIFEPFFTTKGPGKGTGLGLSQAYGFVRQSGGEIRVQSAPAQGACFSIYVPTISGASTETLTMRATSATAIGAMNVLLAEDDAAVAGVTETMLSDLGHTVVRVAGAEEALGVLRSSQPLDLLLSDVVMPGGMHGVDLARQAAMLRPGLKVLLSSGYAGESLDAALLDGAWPFLRKPFRQLELAAAIRELFESERASPRIPAAAE